MNAESRSTPLVFAAKRRERHVRKRGSDPALYHPDFARTARQKYIYIPSAAQALQHLHRLRIPVRNSAAFVANIAQQRGSGGAEAKHSIFHNRLARTHRCEE